jgi:hypothetical protein
MSTTNTTPLTEAEFLKAMDDWAYPNMRKKVLNDLRERGLIEPEPEPVPLVDSELAKAIEGAVFQDERNRIPWSNGFRKGFDRALEITPAERPALTRGKVWAAVVASLDEADMIEQSDFDYEAGDTSRDMGEAFVTRLHTALMELVND